MIRDKVAHIQIFQVKEEYEVSLQFSLYAWNMWAKSLATKIYIKKKPLRFAMFELNIFDGKELVLILIHTSNSSKS